MPTNDILKLAALDEDDLAILSAHVQDAVFRVAELRWEPGPGRLIIPMNRFVWEKVRGKRRARNERRRSVFQLDRVTAVQTQGVDRDDELRVLSLLAVVFKPIEPPSGTVTLVFSGESAIRAQVECVEARLTDLGAAWSATARPKHITGG